MSVRPRSQDHELRIYPVPVHETLHFTLGLEEPSEVSVAIRDLTGRVLIRHPRMTGLDAGENHFTMDIGELRTGSYFVEVHINNTVSTKMIVVI